MVKSLAILFVLFTLSSSSFALADSAPTEEINRALLQIANGKQDEVKAKLLDMLVEYPDDAGVQFVLAAVLEDGFKAKDIYEKILKNYPESEWADDAMWRVLQFSCLIGDTTKSRILLQDFKAKYPNSPYMVPANDIVRTAFGIAKGKYGKAKFSENVAMTEKSVKDLHTDAGESHEENKKESKSSAKATEQEKSKKTTAEKKETSEKKEKQTSNSEKNSDKVTTYGLQVAAYTDRATAEKEMRKFLDNRMRAEVREKKTKDNDVLFTVVIGNYSSMETAEFAKNVVKKECKCDPLIIEK